MDKKPLSSVTTAPAISLMCYFNFFCVVKGVVQPPPACPPSWFTCDDGKCIEAKKVCDFTPHCTHGEDEASCRKGFDTKLILSCASLVILAE